MDTVRQRRRDRKRIRTAGLVGTVTGIFTLTRNGELTRTRIQLAVELSEHLIVTQAFTAMVDIPAGQLVPEVGDKVSVKVSWTPDPQSTEETE